MLELRPNCELCDTDSPPVSADARICTYGFVPRPIGPKSALLRDPPGTERRHSTLSPAELEARLALARDIEPTAR